MVRVDFPSAYPLVVAHRGASAAYPENTLRAFQGAVEAGADVIETDVRLTADGVAVVLHDADVSRCTDGSGLVRLTTGNDYDPEWAPDGKRLLFLDGGR